MKLTQAQSNLLMEIRNGLRTVPRTRNGKSLRPTIRVLESLGFIRCISELYSGYVVEIQS